MLTNSRIVVIEFGFGQHASIAGKHNVAQIAKVGTLTLDI